MAILSILTPYQDGDTVTSTNLNNIVEEASFTSAAVDNVTTQISGTAIVVKDEGIDKDKLAIALKGIVEKVGTAYLGGDKTGNTRSANSLDIQSRRTANTQVASGNESVAVGVRNTSSSYYGCAIGINNTTVGDYTKPKSSAIGSDNFAEGYNSNAFGHGNTVSSYYSNAFGTDNTASGTYSGAFGTLNTASSFRGSAIGHRNTASGQYEASAIGYRNTASGQYEASAIGHRNTASGYANSSAFGNGNTASGFSSIAMGYANISSGSFSTAVGTGTTASGEYSSVFGRRAKTTQLGSTEIGYWSSSTTRSGAIRLHSDGQHAVTIRDSVLAPTDGGATAGSETNGTLPRGMFTLQKNGNLVALFFNDAGTIKSLPVGTLT